MWQPIETVPKNAAYVDAETPDLGGPEVLLLCQDGTGQWYTHIAWWDAGIRFEDEDEEPGFSYYRNSLTQVPIEYPYEPKYWMPFEAPK